MCFTHLLIALTLAFVKLLISLTGMNEVINSITFKEIWDSLCILYKARIIYIILGLIDILAY